MLEFRKVKCGKSILLTTVRQSFENNKPNTFEGRLVCKASERTQWQDSSNIDRLTYDDAMLDAYNMLDDYIQINKELINVCDILIGR